ncbi:unnamed protein product [Clavelina lepadiformis]|uniref:Putative hydroxypyruvate isomerase n=1 Tax=Clavelina lepadiformis TaxID=159417 RepID=A0ABP0FF53_CLALP
MHLLTTYSWIALEMGKLKFCANISWLFKDAPLLERYQIAADAGFLAVEDAWPYEYDLQDLCEAKDRAKVQQISINTGCKDTLGNAANVNCLHAFRDDLDLAIKYANALQCKNIHIMTGKCNKSEDKDKAKEVFIDNLKYASGLLQSHGLVGLIEPINTFSVPNYFLTRSVEALEVLKLVNKPNILYQLDFFHLQIMEGNLSNTLKENFSSIGHIQIAQVPSRHEPGYSGEINFSHIFALLEDLGYSKWIGCEYLPSTSTAESLEWLRKYTKE